MQIFIWNLVLFVVGASAFIWAYLAFSPMTRDLVVFLSRDQQITIFKYRRVYWAVGTFALGWLFLRSIFGLAGPETPADSFLIRGADFLGTAGLGWMIVLVLISGLLGVLYWATFVPVVMAPPKEHRVVSKEEADKLLKPGSWVLGLDLKGKVRAYPRDLIARPHWFNDEIDGKPLMVSYCILCNTGQAFIPILKNGQRLNLRNMTAFDNNTVYHDTISGNFIQQLEGRVVSGPNEGEEFEAYPVVMAKWDEWKALHPDTDLYYAPPLSLRDKVTQKMLETMIPLERLAGRDEPWHLVRGGIDTRLPAMSFVFGVKIGNESCAYPLDTLKESPVITDVVGGKPIVALYDRSREMGQIFHRSVDGQVLTLSVAANNGEFIAQDAETGSQWDITGRATSGALHGKRMESPAHYNQLFWFSWAAFNRDTRINTGTAADPNASFASV